ncbi:hypothetical protein B0H10DRAFT_2189809 [Mycena sp. CBHHK59/15]|nr:hypothetical protein B0H10DRAFT_2189809 [Mycena sp. CBHHK59/15]
MPNPKREIAGDCGQPGLPLSSRLKISLLGLGKEFQMVGMRRPQKRISVTRCCVFTRRRPIKGSLVESNRLTVRLEKQATLLRRRRTAADGTDSNWWLLVWGMEKSVGSLQLFIYKKGRAFSGRHPDALPAQHSTCLALRPAAPPLPSTVCTACGSLVDPTTYVLQYDTWAPLAPKALKTGHNHYISGHGKEARDNKNLKNYSDRLGTSLIKNYRFCPIGHWQQHQRKSNRFTSTLRWPHLPWTYSKPPKLKGVLPVSTRANQRIRAAMKSLKFNLLGGISDFLSSSISREGYHLSWRAIFGSKINHTASWKREISKMGVQARQM